MKRIILAWFLISLLMAIFWPHQTMAASSTGLQLSLEPAIFDLGGAPGTSTSTKIRIKNITKQPELVQATTQSFKPLGTVDEKLLHTTFDVAAWLKVSESVFTLDPGQTKVITITANIPANAEPGGHYATVNFTLLSKASVGTGPHASVNTSISGFALLTVKGPLSYRLTFEKPRLDAEDGQLQVPVKNEGTVHQLITPEVVVKDIFGNKVGQWKGAPTLVLPTERRTLNLPWNINLPGWYKVQINAMYSPRHLKAESPVITVAIGVPLWSIILLSLMAAIGIIGWLGRGRWRKAWRTLWKSY